MDIFEITALVKVVQTGSFTRAAELLNTRKSHLSRTITNLENKLGARLLERNTRNLSLTETGHAVYERAIVILKMIDEAENIAQESQLNPQGLLKITCGVEFGMMFVNHWINTFMLKYPQITVEANFTGDLIDLIQDGYDLAIRIGKLDDSQLIARRLGDLEYGVFASEQYLIQNGIPKKPQDLTEHRCIVFNGGDKNQWSFTQKKETIDILVKPYLSINNTFVARDAALKGLGVVKLPLIIAKEFVGQSMLTQLLTDWNLPATPVNAVFPSSKYLPLKVRCFIDDAISSFNKNSN